ncbi:MAG: F0F1 ATP synthase subunit B [Candidatus Omnitrophica bacterium]|nr:F0F1 ATP synthase subunit B [Candidatus Omnitrophota bacterium]
MTNTALSVELQAVSPAEAESSLLTPDVSMVILTWVTFLLLSAVLYKFAWKPILKTLDEREESIRRSVEGAERIKQELAQMHSTRHQMLKEVEQKSREIMDESRKAAAQLAGAIQHKAKEDAKILLENARRDISEETEKAKMVLRAESARIAVELAGKLIHKNLDSEGNRRFIREFVEET